MLPMRDTSPVRSRSTLACRRCGARAPRRTDRGRAAAAASGLSASRTKEADDPSLRKGPHQRGRGSDLPPTIWRATWALKRPPDATRASTTAPTSIWRNWSGGSTTGTNHYIFRNALRRIPNTEPLKFTGGWSPPSASGHCPPSHSHNAGALSKAPRRFRAVTPAAAKTWKAAPAYHTIAKLAKALE